MSVNFSIINQDSTVKCLIVFGNPVLNNAGLVFFQKRNFFRVIAAGTLQVKWWAPFGIVNAVRVSERLWRTPPPCQGSSSLLLQYMYSYCMVNIHPLGT